MIEFKSIEELKREKAKKKEKSKSGILFDMHSVVTGIPFLNINDDGSFNCSELEYYVHHNDAILPNVRSIRYNGTTRYVIDIVLAKGGRIQYLLAEFARDFDIPLVVLATVNGALSSATLSTLSADFKKAKPTKKTFEVKTEKPNYNYPGIKKQSLGVIEVTTSDMPYYHRDSSFGFVDAEEMDEKPTTLEPGKVYRAGGILVDEAGKIDYNAYIAKMYAEVKNPLSKPEENFPDDL